MTTYALISGGNAVEYPYTFASLKRDNPHTRFDTADLVAAFTGTEMNLAGNTLQPVTVLARPGFDEATEKLVRDALPTSIDDVWTVDWTVVAKTVEEIAAYEAEQLAADMALQCTRSQFMLAALEMGKLDTIEGFIAALNPADPAQREIIIRFREAPIFYRNFPGWNQMAPAIGENAASVTAIFRLANTK